MEIWAQIRRALDAAMLELTTPGMDSGDRKRGSLDQHGPKRNLRLKVSDGKGAELGQYCVKDVDPDAALRVEIQREAEGSMSSSSNGAVEVTGSCVVSGAAEHFHSACDPA